MSRSDDVIMNSNSKLCDEAWNIWLVPVPNENKHNEQTVISQSSNKLSKRVTFEENEDVIIYDLKTKLSHSGKILEILGRNTYLADFGNGPQHISGDIISKKTNKSKCNNSDSQNGSELISQTVENGNENQDMLIDVNDEILSVSTDSSSDITSA